MPAQSVPPCGANEPDGLVSIADSVRIAAYESLPVRERGWIKATLALVENVHGARPATFCSRSVRAESGLEHACRIRPAAWAVFVPGAGFASAPRFAAAIMCARLAGMDNLLVVWPHTDAQACSGALLTVLELAGVEQACTLEAPASTAFWGTMLHTLCGFGSDGRVLYFGGRDGLYADLADAARKLHLAFWAEHEPLLAFDASAPAGTLDKDAICQAHPGTALRAYAPGGPTPTALYTVNTAQCDPGTAQPAPAALILGPGLEGCWLHPDLSPEFFLTRQTALCLATED